MTEYKGYCQKHGKPLWRVLVANGKHDYRCHQCDAERAYEWRKAERGGKAPEAKETED